MTLFFIGILEMIIVTAWTRVVSAGHIIASGLVTVVNILIWYYVLETIVSDLQNWRLIVGYAFGCAIGTMLTTAYFEYAIKRKNQAKAGTKKLVP
ncbi:MAG: DUF5698 domain-containing protein [bacterium]|nr:DUF5698 domain-containing protein [bacterium]